MRIGHLIRKGWQQVEDLPIVPFAPTEVPAYALRAALKLDTLMSAVTTAIAALPEPRKTVAQEKFLAGVMISRDDNLIRYLSNNVPALTKAKIDALFLAAHDIATSKLGA